MAGAGRPPASVGPIFDDQANMILHTDGWCQREFIVGEFTRHGHGAWHKNIVFFDNKDELNDKIQYYLKNDVISNKIISESNKLVSDSKFTQEYQLEKIYNYLIS